MRTLILSAVVLAGCGISQSQINQGGDATGEDGAELSTTSRTYVELRRDLRKCASPMCGGYFVHDVNRVTFSETYVYALDFSNSILGDRDQQQVLEAADGEVVLRGKLGPKNSQGIRSFVVSDAWRGMPGLTAATGDLVFSMKPVTIECFVAPCASFQTKKMNSTSTTLFHQLDTLGVHFVDAAWLQDQAANGGAMVSGQFVDGTDANGMKIKVLQATNVFLALPFEPAYCDTTPPPACASNQVRPYARDAELCLTPLACRNTGICNYAVPTCGAGYTAAQYTGANGCSHVECDPSWIYE